MQDPAEGDQLTTEGKFDELIVKFHRKRDRGESVDPAAFVAEHPEFREQLERYFADVAVIEKMAGPAAEIDTSIADATIISRVAAPTERAGQGESVDQTTDDSSTQAGTFADAKASLSGTGEVPERFGRYRLLRELGRGAMGAVYLAEDEQLQRKVALKVPKFPDGMNSELLERFYREARAAGNLRHPGICPVYDVGEIDGQHFITMAYIEGRPLRNLTESGTPQEITTVAGIVQKIAEAMAVAHKQGVIHRDLKPANVMLDTEDQPVVMDFGLARRSVDDEEKLTQTGMVLGSPAYMSPEQVDSDNERVGPSADIYTLGVIFYELLTGGLPFQGGLMSILRQISMDQPRPVVELRGDVDPVIEELCLKMLAKDAEDRPESMQAVAQQLSDWLEGRRVLRGEAATLALPGTVAARPASEKVRRSDGQPVTANGIQSSPDSVDAGRKRKLLLTAGLGGALLLAASLTFFVRLGKHDVKITLSDPSIRLSVDDEVISIDDGEETVRLSAGPHQLQLQAGSVSAMVDSFVVSKDGKTALQVVLAEGRFDVFSNGRKISQDPLDPDNGQKLARTDTTTPGRDAVSLSQDAGAPPLAVAPFDAAQARAHQEAWAGYLGEPVEKEITLPGDRTMRFALIPPGTFWMGSTDEEIKQREHEDAGSITADNYPTEAPRHRVTISKPFAISRFEVTRGDFRSFVESTGYKTEAERNGRGGGAPINGKYGNSPEILWNTEYGLQQTDDHPVVQVSWNDAVAFCEWLSTRHNATFFLPTEAQWEYVCRAGTETAWHSGNDPKKLKEVAWFREHGNGKTHPVGELKPNAWGLHDVHGNVFEWCADIWTHDYYDRSPEIDPTGSEQGRLRVLRGGCWVNGLHSVNSSYRGSQRPGNSLQMFGFRVAMSIDPSKRATAHRTVAKVVRKTGPSMADGSPDSGETTPHDVEQASLARTLGHPKGEVITPADGTIALFPLVDLKRDTKETAWKRDGEALFPQWSGPAGKPQRHHLLVPLIVSGDYKLEFSFECSGMQNVHLKVPIGDRVGELTLVATGNLTFRPNLQQNPTVVNDPDPDSWLKSKVYELSLAVSSMASGKSTLAVHLDGELSLAWSGTLQEMTPKDDKLSGQILMSVYAEGNPAVRRFENARLRMLTGQAVHTRAADFDGGWALQSDDKEQDDPGAGAGFVVRETPIAHDQDFTIEFWCRLTDLSKDRSFWHPPFSMGVLNGRAVVRHTPADRPEDIVEITGPEITDRWVHQALVVEGNEMRLYVDGVLSGSAAIPAREATASDMPHFGMKAVGELDEVRISRVARYEKSSFTPESRFVPDEATLGLFHLDEGQGTDLIDASGHTVGSFATGSEGIAKLNWVKADGPTAADSKSRSTSTVPADDAGQAESDP